MDNHILSVQPVRMKEVSPPLMHVTDRSSAPPDHVLSSPLLAYRNRFSASTSLGERADVTLVRAPVP